MDRNLLGQCRACGTAVARNAYTCPRCRLRPWPGRSPRENKLNVWAILLFAASFVFAATLILMPLVVVTLPSAFACTWMARREAKRAVAPPEREAPAVR